MRTYYYYYYYYSCLSDVRTAASKYIWCCMLAARFLLNAFVFIEIIVDNCIPMQVNAAKKVQHWSFTGWKLWHRCIRKLSCLPFLCMRTLTYNCLVQQYNANREKKCTNEMRKKQHSIPFIHFNFFFQSTLYYLYFLFVTISIK